jgi:hypothetical protein
MNPPRPRQGDLAGAIPKAMLQPVMRIAVRPEVEVVGQALPLLRPFEGRALRKLDVKKAIGPAAFLSGQNECTVLLQQLRNGFKCSHGS